MNEMHAWKFFRAGGFDQVKLETETDLLALDQLDQKLWVALACPTTGLEFDSRTLALIDTDKDGRIRAPELIAAVKWATASLKNPGDLLKGAPELPLDAINEATPEGKRLLSSARQILSNLGKAEQSSISVDDASDPAKIFASTKFNGDGIVPAEAAPDDATKAVLLDIMACMGSDMDRSGKPGVTQAKVDQFFAEAQAYSDWWKKAETDSTIMPLSASTLEAAATFKVVKPKVEDYFTRCRLAAFDARAVTALNREEKEYLAVGAKDLTTGTAELAAFPLAQVAPAKPLPLREGVNPAWAETVSRFEALVVKPFLNGSPVLTESDWRSIAAKFAAFEQWSALKAGAAVEKLGLKRIREILASGQREIINGLLAKDQALEAEANAIASVERLARYYRDLHRLLNNFVSFRDFYKRKDKAIFQAGTLYLDQRSCDLCLSVEDPIKHAAMAALAGTYLAYCECVRKATGEKRQIVAAFTGGDSDNLMVGRNGIFYDRKGRDWDATITKIIDNPISIRQAFWSPYKKLVRMIEEQIAKRAAAADQAATDRMAIAAAQVAKADQRPAAPVAPKAPEPPKKIDVGVVAALGVAVGAIGTAIASVATGLMRLPAWQIPLLVVAVILLISLPSMVIAWLKLRKRNLGPILDANGWAVNARALINVPFGGSLTRVATLPPGSQRDLLDPFAEKKRPWKTYVVLGAIVVLAICWFEGVFDRLLPAPIRSVGVMGTNAPAYVPPTNAPVLIQPKTLVTDTNLAPNAGK